MAVNDLIQFRKGTSSQWNTVNPVLASGEPGYDLTNGVLKIGDGVSNWGSLSGIGSTSVSNGSSSSSSFVGVRGVISTTGNLSSFAVSGGYPVGYLDLFQDGVKLVSSLDFSATDGSNVTLSNSVPSGTVLEYLTMASGVSAGGGSLSGSVTIPNLGDPSYSSVSLLLHGEGSNSSTTITDNSNSPKTITITGGAQISTAQSKFGSSSIYLPSSSTIATPSSSDFEFGTGDFTVEFWWYVTTLPTSEARLVNFGGPANQFLNLAYGNQSWTFSIVNESVSHVITSSQSVSLNQWHHVAYTRSSNTLYLFFNGTLLGSTGVGGISTPSTSVTFSPGPGGSSYFDEIRITKGVARYTSAFSPPISVFADASSLTLPVTVSGSSGSNSGLSWSSVPSSGTSTGTAGQIAYDGSYFYICTATNLWSRSPISTWNYDPLGSSVVLLMHADGSLADSSSYGRTMTAVGNANTNGDAKFGSNSLAFDGDGDYLTTPSAVILDLGDNYTIECWVYPNSSDLTGGIVHRGLYYASGNGEQSTTWGSLTASIRSLGSFLRFYFYANLNSTDQGEQSVDVSQTFFPANTWTHLAMVRSGTSGKIFANGVLVGTISGLNSTTASDQPLIVGTWLYKVSGNDTYAGYWNGRIDELRITKSARYSSAFTPSTEAFPNP
jgi:hypothetical protein